MNEQERQAAVRRVIARGSDPEAIAEAEGDFGPEGTFRLDGCTCSPVRGSHRPSCPWNAR